MTTPSSLKASGALSDSKIPNAANRHGIGPYLGCLCVAALFSTASLPALAQSALLGSDSGVFVNEALLDGINQQSVPVLPYGGQGAYQGGGYQAQPGYGAGGYNPGGPGTVVIGGSGGSAQQDGQHYVTRPGTLLFPPPRFPRSRVTVIDSGTAAAGGTAYSSNATSPSGNLAGAATQTTSSRVSSSAPAGTSDGKAASRLLVPLPPSISQQAPAPKSVASKPAKPKVTAAKTVPAPPKKVAQAKAPQPPKKAAPAAPVKQATVAKPAAPAKAAPPAPKIAAAPPPPKIVPKAAPTTVPKTASVADASQMKDTTTSLTPPPPPPAALSGSAAAPAAAPTPAPPAQANDTAAAAPSTQTASRGDPAVQVSEVQVLFNSSEAALSGPAKSALESVAEAMLENESSEVQLFAYAGQADIDATQARRLSLSRAMAVRAFLIGKGVRPARMQVRALGNKTTSGSPDRVDIVPAKR